MAYTYSDRVRDEILRMIPPDGTVVGSIGCARGATEGVLVEGGREVHGVDVSPQAIAVAKTRLTSARVIAPSERNLFPPASLDGLILADVLEHLPAAWTALAEFAGYVKDGGWIVISVPNMLYLDSLRWILLRRDWPEHSEGLFDETHIQFLTKRRITRWCERANLDIEAWFDFYDPYGPRRGFVSRWIDRLSLGLLHEFCMFELQLRCRRPAAASRGVG